MHLGDPQPDMPLASQEKQKETLQLSFVEVTPGDFGYDDAISVAVNPKDTQEVLESNLIAKLKSQNWFLQDYWQEKKLKEKFLVSSGKAVVEIYNFGTNLDAASLKAIRDALADLSQLRDNAFEQNRVIIFDNEQIPNPYTGASANGYSNRDDGTLKVYPIALRATEHRVGGVSNLGGTIIHEMAHGVSVDFINEWRRKFGWTDVETPELLPGGAYRRDIVKEPERCVTEYARFNSREDICESIVAALKNPKVLDPERLQFIKDNLFPEEKNELPNVTLKKEEKSSLPTIPQPVKYRRVTKKRISLM